MPRNVFYLLIAVWLASEIALIFTRRTAPFSATSLRRGSLGVIWIVLTASAAAAMASQYLGLLPLPVPRPALWVAADAVIVVGLAVRWTAILTLGRFFTVNVAIHDEHRVVDHGLYRWLRHPSYSGLLLAFLGLGLAFGNWLGLALATIPPTAVFLDRIRVEEAALLRELGEPYRDYCARTKRLVPGLY